MDILTSGKRVCPLGYNTSRVLLLAASLLCLFVSCNPKDDPKPGPEPGPGPEPEPEEVVSKGAYKHVVIIGADGAGAFFRDTDTPRCDGIFAGGATTYTDDKVTIDLTAFPSKSKVVRNAMPDAPLASFVEWNPINVGIVENGLDVVKGTGADDAEVTGRILEYLSANTPVLMFVQFSSPDDIGETYGFGSDIYLATISTVDALIGSIYDKLKAKGILDDTLFIVTAEVIDVKLSIVSYAAPTKSRGAERHHRGA